MLPAQADHRLMPMERIMCSVEKLYFQFGKVANFPRCVESMVVAHTQWRNLMNPTMCRILNHKMKLSSTRVSNPWPAGHMWPRMAVNAAQHKS